MTAKHHSHTPKRQRRPDDLEKRIRRIERNYVRDATKIATHVARVEIAAHEAANSDYMKAWHENRHTLHALGSDSYTEGAG